MVSTHSHSYGLIHVPPVTLSRGMSPLSLPSGPSKLKAAMLAQYGSQEAYAAALLAAKKKRRQQRSAEVVVLRKILTFSEMMSPEQFKGECEALLDNLRAMPQGKPKSPEQMHLELAQFAERWFRRGQHKPSVDSPVSGATETAKPDVPHVEIIPAARGPIGAVRPQFVPPTEEYGGRAANPANIAGMEFTRAAGIWLQKQRVRIRPSTVESYVQRIKMLAVYFGGMHLDEIHSGHLLEFQSCRTLNVGGTWFTSSSARPTPWEHTSGQSNTNHDINTLSQILRLAKLWKNLSDDYKPIPSSGFKKPKVMTNDQKRLFYITAASRPEWLLALWVAAITNNTTASGSELRNLTLGDVFLDAQNKPYIQINPETAKCRNRGRDLYLNANSRAALRMAVDRARELGAHRPQHYVFPFRAARNRYDVTRPASSSWLRAAWVGLREATGLDWITPHGMRHQCLTEMMEVGVPPEQMRKIAGHLTSEMTDHYTHNRMQQQAESLDRLADIPEIVGQRQQ